MTPEKTKRVAGISLQKDASLLQALQLMDQTYAKLLLVFDGPRFASVLSVGDIQRAIVRQAPLTSPVASVLRPKVRVARPEDTEALIRQQMIEHRAECMPVVAASGDLLDVIFWDDLFSQQEGKPPQIDAPAVIMAGGQGTRMRPLTNIIPKPLIPVGDKPIIEDICDRLHQAGTADFYISLNYKAGMVEQYFAENPKPYRLHYFREDRPMGTAGSLRLLAQALNRTFIVSNCDILVEHDMQEIYKYHLDNRCELTAVAALKLQAVPYGIFECDETGMLTSIREKPHVPLLVNVGLYILEPHLLAEIPDEFFHITHLMERIRQRGGRVGVFPVREGDWVDMGDWNEYMSAMLRRRNATVETAR